MIGVKLVVSSKIRKYILAVIISTFAVGTLCSCSSLSVGIKGTNGKDSGLTVRSYPEEYNEFPQVVWMGGQWVCVDATGNPDYTYDGIARNEFGYWLVEDGIVNFDYTGPVYFNGRYYMIIGGQDYS